MKSDRNSGKATDRPATGNDSLLAAAAAALDAAFGPGKWPARIVVVDNLGFRYEIQVPPHWRPPAEPPRPQVERPARRPGTPTRAAPPAERPSTRPTRRPPRRTALTRCGGNASAVTDRDRQGADMSDPDVFEAMEIIRGWCAANYPRWRPDVLVLRLLDSGTVREVQLPFPPPPPAAGVNHSADFRSCTVHGEEYDFGPAQAAVVRQLWEAHDSGTPAVGQETLLEGAGLDGDRLRDVFRKNGQAHPAWGVLVVQGAGKGTFRLDLDGDSQVPQQLPRKPARPARGEVEQPPAEPVESRGQEDAPPDPVAAEKARLDALRRQRLGD